QKKSTTVRFGKVFTAQVKLDVPFEKKRTVRVYLPENYEPSNSYPVMYMSDGQNLFDKYTSAFGDWKIDLRMHELIKQGYPSFIVVGIDCPKNPHYRILEYSFPKIDFLSIAYKSIPKSLGSSAYGDQFLACLIKKVKPMVEKNFSTSGISAIGGSSMGGVFALNGYISYPDIFSFCLSFSPAYHLFNRQQLYALIDRCAPNLPQEGKIFLYTGAMGYERQFFNPTISMFRFFNKLGYKQDRIALITDSRMAHHEDAWSHYFNPAMQFWLKKPSNQGKM
ncbi:MAG TPA: alpha/beta hydrolase-fold protein, partial [Bacilli bacterium]|nr:alpha/beta hydrolase-fold protein [Bacilli bacterium]